MEQIKFGKYTYDRVVEHCDISPHCQEVTIKSIEPAQNSDKLNVIMFNEVAWQLVAGKDAGYSVGQRVMYFPPESVLPLEFSNELDVTKYLDHGKVRSIKLRGNRSEGLCASIEVSKKYLDGVYQWNTPESRKEFLGLNKAPRMRKKLCPDNFVKFHDMCNIMNAPNVFRPGDKVFYSEKIHGMNARFGVMVRTNGIIMEYLYRLLYWITGNQMFAPTKFCIGSHNVVLNHDGPYAEKNKFVSVIKEMVGDEHLPVNIEFFGELHGPGVQKGFHYDLEEPMIRVFAAKDPNGYIQIPRLTALCDILGLPRVNFHELTFESIDQLRALSESPSEYTSSHIREGIVVVGAEDAGRMTKVVSLEYLSQKS